MLKKLTPQEDRELSVAVNAGVSGMELAQLAMALGYAAAKREIDGALVEMSKQPVTEL